jgi:hypothetical protein
MTVSSCKKEKNEAYTPSASQPADQPVYSQIADLSRSKIHVNDIEGLYAAVNDPANAGKEIVLARGTYVLNASYPNGGRLELQNDMALSGKPGQKNDVWIDQSFLPTSSFVIPAGRTGGIRMGLGTNKLEWLSIKGGAVASNPFSVINTDLLSTETTINLSHLHIEVNGANIGVNLRNRLAEHAGRKISAQLKSNEVTGAVNFNGFALAFQNANGASGAEIAVTMINNHIHGNKVGLLAFSSAQTLTIQNCKIKVLSFADRFEGNGLALDPSAGVNQALTTVADNNSTVIEMVGTKIRDNNPSPLPSALAPVNGALPGGVYAATAFNTVNNAAGVNRANNNVMRLRFWGCDISNNGPTDIYGYAAWCPPATILAGSDNRLDLFLIGRSSNVVVDAQASVPAEPAGTYVINVFRF